MADVFVRRIQYMRHLHDKVKVLDERTAPAKTEAEEANAEVVASIIGGSMMPEQLMLGNGGNFGAFFVFVFNVMFMLGGVMHLLCE